MPGPSPAPDYRVRTQCAVCSADLVDVFAAGRLPLANAFRQAVSGTASSFPCTLASCVRCGLAQLREVLRTDHLTGGFLDVRPQPSGMAARALVRRLKAHGVDPRGRIVDVGFTHGTLAAPLAAAGVDAWGIDAYPEATAGERTLPGLLDAALAERALARNGHADVVVMRHVIGHVPDPRPALEGARRLLKDEGHLLLATPDTRAVRDGLAYDLVFHEHLAFFDPGSLSHALAAAGLVVLQTSLEADGTMWALARPATPAAGGEAAEVPPGAWYAFGTKVAEHRSALRARLEEWRGDGLVVAGYGAAARAVTLLAGLPLRAGEIIGFADQNTRKKGLRMPGSGLDVMSPSELLARGPDVVLAGVSARAPEIAARLRDGGYTGPVMRWLPSIERVP